MAGHLTHKGSCSPVWEANHFRAKWINHSGPRDFPGGPVVKTSLSNAGGAGSVPGGGTRVPHASWAKKRNIKQKQYCNKFNKDFTRGPH